MADVPTRAQGFLWHGRLHEVDRHERVWPEDLRGELAPGGEVRLEEPIRRLLPPRAASRRPARRGVREWSNRPIREPSSRAPWQGYLVDGRRRVHRLLS